MIEILVVAGFVVLLLMLAAWRSDRDFKQQWPAISEDEFVAKCTPGVDRETALKVRRIISEQLGVPYEHIHPDQRFVEDLYCD